MLESLQNNKFTYQRLTEEEQAKRGILGRLVGIIADTKNPTRNGRHYSAELWEKVFDNPIMQEKIKNRCCFGECGHPTDREEVDMEKIAICLAEKPKIGDDGNLYGVFDILSTPCGRILKSLCDYGCNIGVSSRGTGDLYTDDNGNESVDPDTYDCECWDAVLIPAVESARLQYVTEALDKTRYKKSLKQTLTEAYNKANDEDKKVMKETLENLDIKLEEEVKEPFAELKESLDDEEFKKLMELGPKCGINTMGDIKDFKEKHNCKDDKEFISCLEKCAAGECEDCKEELEVEEEEVIEEACEKKDEAFDDIPWAAEEEPLVEDADEEEIEAEEKIEEPEVEEDKEEKSEAYTVGDLLREIGDYDEKLDLEFKPIEIEGKEYEINALEFSDDEGKVVVNIGYTPVMEDNIDNEEDEEIPEEVEDDAEAEIEEDEVVEEDDLGDDDLEDEDETVEAVDDGSDEEVIESLKEAIREKDSLEQEVKDLKSEKAVGDAKVEELQEELKKYKTSFIRLSEVAANAKRLEAENKALTEKLSNKEAEGKEATKLTESLNDSAKKVKILTERLEAKNVELKEAQEKIDSQTTQYKKSISASRAIVEKYKARCNEAEDKYIEMKADMLGVRPQDIKNRLTENYTISDIEDVCEDLFAYSMNVSSLPFDFSNSRIKINEARKNRADNRITNPDDGYDIDDDLLILAGLKK